MYDIKWIREHPAEFDRGLTRRGLEPLSGKLIKLDEERRALITRLEQAQASRNAASKDIGQAKAKKDEATAQKLMAEVAELKTSIPTMEAKEKEASAALDKEIAQIPNMPLDEVPDGKDEHGNVEYRQWGNKRNYAFTPKQHFELGEALGQMDFEMAAKLSGARFVVLQKGLARMERSLGQFMLDVHTDEKHGYTEVNPPLMVRDNVMFGTAQLPKFREDQFISISHWLPSAEKNELLNKQAHQRISEHYSGQMDAAASKLFELTKKAVETSDAEPKNKSAMVNFLDHFLTNARKAEENLQHLQRDNLYLEALFENEYWLIPTAEVPLTNLVRESIIDEDTLPRRYTACTPCFRAEAGAAGKDTRGMIRQHQFTKVELVSITTPEQSRAEHERMLNCAEEILKKLDLHYRVITLCTGDMGFASQKTYDIEVWLPGQGQYREISSCSVCGDFQARRMNARYRPRSTSESGVARAGAGRANQGPRFVHTLNGSGVAVGRALIAVMETYQQADGSIEVPEALKPYMGGVTKIERVA
jgi:seryl-tRNA synthetase